MKKESLIIVPLALLGATFVIVSMLVVISGGNSWLIRKKLKLGAMIISINAMALGTSGLMTGCLMCYDPAPSNSICLLDEEERCNYNQMIVISGNELTTLEGRISGRTTDDFIYKIRETEDTGDVIIQDHVIIKIDSEAYTESFEITIDGSLLSPGEYLLSFYEGTIEDHETYSLVSYRLLVE